MMPILIMPEAAFYPDPMGLKRTTLLAPRRSFRWRSRVRTTYEGRAAWRARAGIADPVVIVARARQGNEPCDKPAGEASLAECEALLKALIRRKRCELSRAARAELAAIRKRPAGQKHGLSAAVMTWVLGAMSWYGTSTPHSLFAPILHPPTLLVQWWTAMPREVRFGPARELLRRARLQGAGVQALGGRGPRGGSNRPRRLAVPPGERCEARVAPGDPRAPLRGQPLLLGSGVSGRHRARGHALGDRRGTHGHPACRPLRRGDFDEHGTGASLRRDDERRGGARSRRRRGPRHLRDARGPVARTRRAGGTRPAFRTRSPGGGRPGAGGGRVTRRTRGAGDPDTVERSGKRTVTRGTDAERGAADPRPVRRATEGPWRQREQGALDGGCRGPSGVACEDEGRR